MQLFGCSATLPSTSRFAFAGRYPKRSSVLRVVARSGGRPSRGSTESSGANHYEILEVMTDASDAEIKANYRKLQKDFHPDRSGDQYSELSAKMNEAFTTLKNPKLRQDYDKELKAANKGRMPGSGDLRRRASGLVGPVRGGNLLLQSIIALSEDEKTSSAQEVNRRLVIWIREWCRTLVFAAANPLPLSMQADDVLGGNRMSFITVNDGCVETVGALEITVVGADTPAQAEEGIEGMTSELVEESFQVQVRRITFGQNLGFAGLPGEDRILSSLRSALRARKRRMQQSQGGLGLSGLAALITSGFMGGASIFGMQNEEVGDLEAYHLKHPFPIQDGSSSSSNSTIV